MDRLSVKGEAGISGLKGMWWNCKRVSQGWKNRDPKRFAPVL